jgi:hypothetical protein
MQKPVAEHTCGGDGIGPGDGDYELEPSTPLNRCSWQMAFFLGEETTRLVGSSKREPARRLQKGNSPESIITEDSAQPKVHVVHQSRGLKRVAGSFIFHVPAGHAAQFLIYDRRQPVQRRLIAAAPSL